MMYPITLNVLYIQTNSISSMTVSGSTYTVIMTDTTTHVVSQAQFYDIISQVNENHG